MSFISNKEFDLDQFILNAFSNSKQIENPTAQDSDRFIELIKRIEENNLLTRDRIYQRGLIDLIFENMEVAEKIIPKLISKNMIDIDEIKPKGQPIEKIFKPEVMQSINAIQSAKENHRIVGDLLSEMGVRPSKLQ